MSEPYLTRREADLMKADADAARAELKARVEAIDQGGTRGVIGLQVQVQDQTKELTRLQASVDELRRDVDRRFDGHDGLHEREDRARASARRWLIGTIVAAVMAVEAPLGYVITHLH